MISKKPVCIAFKSIAMVGLLAFIACSGDKSVTPSVPTTIAANSSTSLSGIAGVAVSPAPSVVVRDENGEPSAGVIVDFAVTGGGGSVSTASAQTDASGIATVAWTLGTSAGPNSLSASTGTLAAVTFTATGTAGAAATLTKSAGDNQTGVPGAAVAVPPQVTVKDANGNPKSGVTVTFAVASGGGSVAGATATSNAQGVATVGSWTLGPAAGANTLTAFANGLPGVTFTATAIAATGCAARSAHTLGTTSQGTLAAGDCSADGFFIDLFSTTLGGSTAYLFRQTASFDTYLFLAAADGSVIAENDDEIPNGASTNSGIKAFLPAGSYLLGASSFQVGTTGDYSITSSATSGTVSGCERVFVLKGFSTTQSVEPADCLRTTPPAAPVYGDAYVIFLRVGQSVRVTMTSVQVDAFIEVVNNVAAVVASNDNRDASTKDSELTFTAPESHYYTIIARTGVTSQTGTYTLTIN